MKKLTKIVIIVMLAAAINLGLFLLALQMGDTDVDQDNLLRSAIRLATVEPPPPPEQLKPKDPPKEQQQPMTVKRVQNQNSTPRPNVNVNLPRLNIDVNPRLTAGFAIDPSLIGEAREALATQFKGVFGLDEVDEAPSVLRSIEPEYPYQAKRQGINGVVEVRVLVNADGVPEQVHIESANPKGIFEDAVMAAVRKWRFRPGVKDGQKVPTWVIFPVRFEIKR